MSNFYNHPLYVNARQSWIDTQKEQIKKGEEKYPEPLNPDSLTFEELVKHAFQENVDQAHYLTALLYKYKAMERELEKLGCYNAALLKILGGGNVGQAETKENEQATKGEGEG